MFQIRDNVIGVSLFNSRGHAAEPSRHERKTRSLNSLAGLSNEAKRNAKADLLRTVPHTETKLRNLNYNATPSPAMADAHRYRQVVSCFDGFISVVRNE
ncbi:hypothetical protein BH09BAC3_BH09BAC3_14870 [soil metagenome]